MIRREIRDYASNANASPAWTLDKIQAIVEALETIDDVNARLVDPAEPTRSAIDPDKPF